MTIGFLVGVAAFFAVLCTSNATVPTALGNLFNAVEARNPDNDPTGFYEYRYQRIIYETAGVDPAKDSEAEVARKVRNMWNAHRDVLTCSNMQFNVSNGSVLKFAASRTFTPFMEDAIQLWKLDFDYVDAADGRILTGLHKG